VIVPAGAIPAEDQVIGIVLAAGSSQRLGRPKQSLPFGDTSLLGWALRNIEQSALDRVLVVVGGAAEETLAGLDPSRASVVLNPDHDSGCSSSLLAGIDAAGPCAAVMMLLGDMPGVDATVIDSVLTAWRQQPTWAAVTRYQDRLGHPFVFSAAAVPTLRALHGDKAVWKVVDRESDGRVRRIDVDRPCPGDVDTWDDYRAVADEVGAAIEQDRDLSD
jgi:molybdenum cofactor cytidylyltransferase